MTAYLGFGVFAISGESNNSFVCPRAGVLTNLSVNVTTNTLVGASTITIRKSDSCNGAFADTALSISVGSGTTGCFVDTDSVAVAQGDRVSCAVVLPAGSGLLIDLSAGLQYT